MAVLGNFMVYSPAGSRAWRLTVVEHVSDTGKATQSHQTPWKEKTRRLCIVTHLLRPCYRNMRRLCMASWRALRQAVVEYRVRPCGREGISPRPGDPRTTAPPRLSHTEEPQARTSKTGTCKRGISKICQTAPSTPQARAAPSPLAAWARSAGRAWPAGARWRVGAEQARAGDGPQRPFVGWRGFVLCGPRLTRGVRPCGREGTSPRPGDPRTTAPPRLSTTEEPQDRGI